MGMRECLIKKKKKKTISTNTSIYFFTFHLFTLYIYKIIPYDSPKTLTQCNK